VVRSIVAESVAGNRIIVSAAVLTEKPLGQSLLMVPNPCALAIVALTGLERFTKKVSLASTKPSPQTEMVTGR
jgi:hypothetical protein